MYCTILYAYVIVALVLDSSISTGSSGIGSDVNEKTEIDCLQRVNMTE